MSAARNAILSMAALVIPFAHLTAQRPLPQGTRDVGSQVLEIDARQSGPAEITVSWTPVGAVTTYYIARLAPPSGWQRLYPVNPRDTLFVDRNVAIGRKYTYQVAAQIGDRVTRRVTSDTVLVAEGVFTAQPADGNPPE